MKRCALWLAILGLGFAAAPAGATTSPIDLIRGVFETVPTTVPADFSDTFLAQVPYATVRAVANDVTARLGSVRAVAATGDDYAVAFERGSAVATIHLDASGKIDGLRIYDEESPADEAALTNFLTVATIDAAQFAPAVRGLVRIDELQALREQLRRAGGQFVRVAALPSGYVAQYERAQTRVAITTDASGLISAIFFKPLEPRAR